MRKLLVLPIVASLMAGACASASATGKGKDTPALNVPPPPPRVIEPTPEPLPEPVSEIPTTAAPPATSGSSRTTRPPAKSTTDTKPAEPKPVEQPPTEPPPAPVPQPPSQPPAQLRTPQTANTSDAVKAVKATIDRANALLSGVDYRLLTPERRKAYDDARRFIQNAEDAVKQGNLVFAQGVATKAETLAKELAGR